MKQRSTMTNFAKKAIIEQNMIQSIPSDGGPSLRTTTAGATFNNSNTFDDDYEPVRPSMSMQHNQVLTEAYPPSMPPSYENSH